MTDDEKGFQLVEAITSLAGVKSAEVYKKSTGENVWDVLVSTETGRLVEQTLAGKEDLEILQKYIELVVSVGDSNIRSYPSYQEQIDEQNKS